MVTGFTLTAFAGAAGTAFPSLPAFRNQTEVVYGQHTGSYTNINLRGDAQNVYCNVYYGKGRNVTGTFSVAWNHTVKARNTAPQKSNVALYVGNNDYRLVGVSASITYDL